MRPIEEIVRNNNPFVLSPSSVKDTYDLMGYIYAAQNLGIELRAMLDNNILTRVISLAKGKPVPQEESQAKAYILSSAVMAFLIIGRFEIEQRISIHEKRFSSNRSQAERELHISRVADNIRVKVWIDIALRRKKEISKNEINDSETKVASVNYENAEKSFSQVIPQWKINYYFVLKASEIWKSSSNNVNNACKFIHWMEEEWFFAAVPLVFIMVFFSPNRYSKMIKGIDSLTKQKVIYGLQNAAWDLTYIRMWSSFYQTSNLNRLWLLCSNDIALRSIAKMQFAGSEQSENPELEQLQEYWSASDAQRIFDVYKQARADITNDKDKRQQKIEDRIETINDFIAYLEAKVFGT
jgi:hypothetical protein